MQAALIAAFREHIDFDFLLTACINRIGAAIREPAAFRYVFQVGGAPGMQDSFCAFIPSSGTMMERISA